MLNLENEGALFAIIKNENKTIKDKKMYVSDNENNVKKGFSNYECDKNEILQLVPNTKTERQCIYICGQSGSGKSYFTSQYVKQYKKTYPKNDIFVISSIAEDKAIDILKPIRINVLHEDFLQDEFTSEDFKNSLVIADDVDVFPTKIRKKVMSIVNNILVVGRHSNVSMCFTTHNPCAGNETKLLLSEAHVITVFPKTTGNRALKYLLDSYLGLDKKTNR
jgi:chromosomal replication initiation ATPase DnaA